MKIHIIGGSGSGKSYLSRELFVEFGVENYELDDIFWDNSEGVYGKKRNKVDRDTKLQSILSKDEWIVEGVYHKWLYQSFADADVIVMMIPSVWKQHYRVILRFIKRKLGIEYTNKKETINGLVKLIKWNHRYNADKLYVIFDFISEFEDKTIVVGSSNEAKIEIIRRYMLT